VTDANDPDIMWEGDDGRQYQTMALGEGGGRGWALCRVGPEAARRVVLELLCDEDGPDLILTAKSHDQIPAALALDGSVNSALGKQVHDQIKGLAQETCIVSVRIC
jgi:hypothetical protein